jgi:hypothetical protein
MSVAAPAWARGYGRVRMSSTVRCKSIGDSAVNLSAMTAARPAPESAFRSCQLPRSEHACPSRSALCADLCHLGRPWCSPRRPRTGAHPQRAWPSYWLRFAGMISADCLREARCANRVGMRRICLCSSAAGAFLIFPRSLNSAARVRLTSFIRAPLRGRVPTDAQPIGRNSIHIAARNV